MRKVCFDCNYETGDDIECCPKCGKKLILKNEQKNSFLEPLDKWPADRFFYVSLICLIISGFSFLVFGLISLIVKDFGGSVSYNGIIFLAGFVIAIFGKKMHPESKKNNIIFWIYIITLIIIVLLIIVLIAMIIINFPYFKAVFEDYLS